MVSSPALTWAEYQSFVYSIEHEDFLHVNSNCNARKIPFKPPVRCGKVVEGGRSSLTSASKIFIQAGVVFGRKINAQVRTFSAGHPDVALKSPIRQCKWGHEDRRRPVLVNDC